MLDDKEERIRSEAYRRWEQEGRPHGEHDRHWQEASQALENGKASETIESESAVQALKAPKVKVAKPKAAKAAAPNIAAPKAAPAQAAAEGGKPAIATPKRTRAKSAAAE